MDTQKEAPAPEVTGSGREHEHGQALAANSITTRRRLPPHARRIIEARRRGEYWGFVGTSADGSNPTLWLLVGAEAWQLAEQWQSRRLVVVAPPDEDPVIRDWSCLACADPVLLVPCGAINDDHLQRIVAACMRDGVERILDIETGARFIAKEGP